MGMGESVKMVINYHLRLSFDHILRLEGATESEWALFRSAIVEAAAVSCSRTVTGANRGGKTQTQR